jgi:hypothetical protein
LTDNLWSYNQYAVMQELARAPEEIDDGLPTGREVGLSLLYSRKALLALAGAAITIVAHYLGLPAAVWAAIDALLITVIAGIAYEDGAEKSASR